jgi:hypothetical protein
MENLSKALHHQPGGSRAWRRLEGATHHRPDEQPSPAAWHERHPKAANSMVGSLLASYHHLERWQEMSPSLSGMAQVNDLVEALPTRHREHETKERQEEQRRICLDTVAHDFEL